MPRKIQTAGFSLIEFLVATLAASVLALTAGSMLYYGYLAWVGNSEAVEVQRDATVALRTISEHIREAAPLRTTVVSTPPARITIQPTNAFMNSTVRFYDDGAGSLMFDPDISSGGDEVALIDGRLAAFTVIDYPPAGPTGIRVTLSLSGGGEATSITAVMTYRNST